MQGFRRTTQESLDSRDDRYDTFLMTTNPYHEQLLRDEAIAWNFHEKTLEQFGPDSEDTKATRAIWNRLYKQCLDNGFDPDAGDIAQDD